ncbi:oxidoreductase [Actinoplanes lobatus]|uniref:NAD(P)H-flavin reductase n=1 Tax=Actinoplanes lobatus TaxID=113568 RepID=A0A7W7HN59_9ACTN|nr:FAD/NAD(P)-binding protein [Actinoplanes lobatus]MBB4753580.1 NAD(P)H-flavin reductase [Actinoplanes lobatus]GGN84705.1 oxidoreductase [Actinoplanes lobatus]GIE38117.1 oxidoreductase [Actinoplanes lobatus]
MSATAEAELAGVAVPCPYRVLSRLVDTDDTVTLTLGNDAGPLPAFAPGQFAMLTAYGIGEVPISLSGVVDTGDGRARRLVHTLRAVGAVTHALHGAVPGGVVGVRGPFGTCWDVASAVGRDVVIVAGGIGLAPLRPLIRAVTAERSRYGRVTLLAGARTPADVLYRDELRRWGEQDVDVAVTVDRPDHDWTGHVGVVTTLIPRAAFEPAGTVAFVCGPEVMMRFTAAALLAQGVAATRIRVSLERNMRCGAGWCGHCQLGPLLVCRDGPVVDWSRAAPLTSVREL